MNFSATLKTSLLALMWVSHSAMAESLVNFSIGYEQTSGDYGSDNTTDITTVPLNLQYMNDAWRVKLSVPFISVTGDGTVIPGTSGGIISMNPFSGPGSSSSSMNAVETQSGLGDIVTSLSYAFSPEKNSFMFSELTAEVKWGTASAEKYLGTGENDYSLNLYTMYDKYGLKPYLSLGYLVMGDTEVTDYNDVVFATTGLMYQLSENALVSVSYDYQQTTIDGIDDSETVSLYLSKKLHNKWSANVYALSGLSDSVADSGFGITLVRDFD